MKFEFDMNTPVQVIISGETGLVIGRVEYMTCENRYLVRYRAADGRAVEDWWDESALQSPEVEKPEGPTNERISKP